jgi:hypothetical protein
MGLFGLFSSDEGMKACEECGRLIPKSEGVEIGGRFLCQKCASSERDLDDFLFDDLMDDDDED